MLEAGTRCLSLLSIKTETALSMVANDGEIGPAVDDPVVEPPGAAVVVTVEVTVVDVVCVVDILRAANLCSGRLLKSFHRFRDRCPLREYDWKSTSGLTYIYLTPTRSRLEEWRMDPALPPRGINYG